MRRRLRLGTWWLAAGLAAFPAWSAPQDDGHSGGEEARRAMAVLCDAAPATAAIDASLPLLEQLLREPAAALARICARPPSTPAALALALQQGRMAWQLLERPFSAELTEALAGLEPVAGARADEEARVWFLMLAARAALDRAARDEAVPLVSEALSLWLAQQAGGVERDVMLAQLRVLEIAASWRRQAPGWVERSEASLSEASALLQGHGLALSALMGEVLNLRTVVSHAQDQLALAASYAEQEAELLRQMGRGETPDMLDALASLAAIYGQMEQMDRSQQALEDALRIIERHPAANPSAQLGVFHNLASNYLHHARVDEALALALRAVSLAEATFGATSPRLLPYRLSLLNLRLTQGQLGEALAVSEAIDAMLGPNSASSVGLARVMRARHLQSVLWRRLGQPRHAAELLAPLLAQSEARSDLGYWRSRLLLSHAAVQMQLGQPAQAYRDYDTALQALRPIVGDTPSLLLEAYGGRCRAAVAQQSGQAACGELQQFLDQHPDYDGLPPADRARAHQVLAQWQDSRADWPAGLAHHLRGLAAAESHAAPAPLWDNLHGLARHWARRGREDLALQLGRQSLDQIEFMRRDLRGKRPGQERGFVQELSSVYRDQAAWLARSGRIAEAQDVLRDWSALELDEFSDGQLRVRRSARWRTPEALLTLNPSAAGPERGGVEPALVTPVGGEVWSSRRLAQAQQHWRAQRESEALKLQQWQQWMQLALQAAAPQAAAASSLRRKPVALQRPASGVLEVWSILGQERLSLLMVHAGGQSQIELAWPARQLGQDLAELLRKIEAREPVDAELRHWFNRLGEPLLRAARQAKARQVEVYLDGALRYLPLGLLRGPDGYLGQSLRLVQRLPEGDARESAGGAESLSALSGARLRAFGSSQAVAGLPALPAVVQEICELVAGPIEGLGQSACPSGAGLWRGQGWLDASFTQRTLQEQLQAAARNRGGSLLHLGTHFTLRPGVMSRSWLRLGDGQRLHLAELARMPFTHTQLVTLSACSTGLGGGDDGSGAEVAGLNASLLQAGASEVLSSLWSVDDAATRRWMRAFYAALRRHGDSARALQSAQREFLARSAGGQSHPFFWGAFYLARAATQR